MEDGVDSTDLPFAVVSFHYPLFGEFPDDGAALQRQQLRQIRRPHAFSGQNASLCGDHRDGHKESRKPRCFRRLRPKTKQSAKPVDLTVLSKWGGGALCHEETVSLCHWFVSKRIPLLHEQAKCLYADTQSASILENIDSHLKINEDNCGSLSPIWVISKSNRQRFKIPFPSNWVGFQNRTD